jgi:hypothetical protein
MGLPPVGPIPTLVQTQDPLTAPKPDAPTTFTTQPTTPGVVQPPTVKLLAGLTEIGLPPANLRAFSGAPTMKATSVAGSGGIVPPSALYIGPEDIVQFIAIGNGPTPKLQCLILFLNMDGGLQLLAQELDMVAAYNFPSVNFQPGEGFALSCSVEFISAPDFGSYAYASVKVRAPSSPNLLAHAQLFGNYVGYVGSRVGQFAEMRAPGDGKGFPLDYDFADLSQPGDRLIEANQLAQWRLRVIALQLNTDATVKNRTVRISLTNPNGWVIWEQSSIATIPAGQFQKMYWAVGSPYFKDAAGVMFGPLPDPLFMQDLAQLKILIDNKAAGDVFQTLSVQVDEWAFI